MDVFTPSQITTPATEQNRLASPRNPGSLARSWQNAEPLHTLARDGRVNAGQLAARLQRNPTSPQSSSKDMFPFRIFQMPPQMTSNPGWTDAYGTAAWRTFSVWTGAAVAWLQQNTAANAPANCNVAVPQLVYVARTAGYPLAGVGPNTVIGNSGNTPNRNNSVIQGWSFQNENYNEFYATVQIGLYPPNPANGAYGGPNNTGPANYPLATDNSNSGTLTPTAAFPNNYRELIFTAPPSSVAVFWISWDTNNNTPNGLNSPADSYFAYINQNTYASFPTLHFGGVTSNADYIAANGTPYFGDLNTNNGAAIIGFLASDNAGTPSQLYPYIPAGVLSGLSGGSQTPEGTMIIGAIQVGALGAIADTGNDGILQIFQLQHENIQSGLRRIQWRGRYANNHWYMPNELVTENDTNNCNGVTTFVNATPFAVQGYDPQVNLSNQPLSDNVNFATFKNFFMPVGGISQALTVNIAGNNTNAYFLMTQGFGITNAPT